MEIMKRTGTPDNTSYDNCGCCGGYGCCGSFLKIKQRNKVKHFLIYIYIYIYISVYICIYIHTHTYTYIFFLNLESRLLFSVWLWWLYILVFFCSLTIVFVSKRVLRCFSIVIYTFTSAGSNISTNCSHTRIFRFSECWRSPCSKDFLLTLF